MRRTGCGVVVVALVLVASAPVVVGQEPGPYVPHPPISIESDEEFGLPGTGVVSGSGTEDDPYVIAGWEIDIRAWPADTAIVVANTSAFFVVRDVRLQAPEASGTGVDLRNVTNAAFAQMEVNGGGNGFTLIDSTNVGLSNVTMSSSFGWGVQAMRVSSVTVADVSVIDPPSASHGQRAPALAFHDADNVSMSRIVVEDEETVRYAALRISDAADVGLSHSRLTGSVFAIEMFEAENVSLAENRLHGAATALRLWGPGTVSSDGDLFVGGTQEVVEVWEGSLALRGAHLVGGDVGLVVRTGSSVDAADCRVEGANATGIRLSDVVDSRIANCTIRDHGLHGVTLYGVRTTIRDNTFVGNGGFGLYFSGRDDGANRIEGNDLRDNRLGDIYIEDRVGNNQIADNNGTVEHDYDLLAPAPAMVATVAVLLGALVAYRRRHPS